MMNINIKIVPNDMSTVAKVVIIDSKDRVLKLKRSQYMKKHAKEWDLPGGHLKQNEALNDGLKREVLEETGLNIENTKFIEQKENLYFFMAKYNSEPIKLSHEHTDYRFFAKEDLDPNEKFDKIAIRALEIQND